MTRRDDDNKRADRPSGDEKVTGYWHNIDVPRDDEDAAARAERVHAATERRQARQAADRDRGPGRRHEVLGRQMRGRTLDFAALIGLVIVGLAVALVIISQQKAALPGWIPVLGEDHFHLDGELSSAQAVTPGQGQSVMVAGIEIGQITSVELEDGHAVVGMDLDPEYAPVIRADAQLLLRPKTNLQDMVIEIDPGSPEAEPIAADTTIPLSRTQPNVNPDELLARFDGDTRRYLALLIQGGAEGLGGRGKQLSRGLRRLLPLSHYIAELNGALAKRRTALARVVHDFGLLTEELARHDSEITRFVGASADALGGFADQADAIRGALRELPPTLRTTRGALTSAETLSTELRPTLTELIPQAQALQPGLEGLAGFFSTTTPTLRDQLRPFTRQVRPVVRHVSQLAEPLEQTVARFGNSLEALNYGFNELAFNPGAANPGYLFYLPWLNHNLNATYTLQDGAGPIRRGVLLTSCNSTYLAGGFVKTRPFLNTIYQATNVPTEDEIC